MLQIKTLMMFWVADMYLSLTINYIPFDCHLQEAFKSRFSVFDAFLNPKKSSTVPSFSRKTFCLQHCLGLGSFLLYYFLSLVPRPDLVPHERY